MRYFFFLFLSLCACSEQKEKLYLFTFEAVDPALLDAFEKEFNCTLYVDGYESNEAMYAKLKAIGSGYDLINPSSYFITTLSRQDLLEPINQEWIPNLRLLDQERLVQLGEDPEALYSVPYTLSYSVIGYRKDMIPNVDSWYIFDESSLKGRMTMLNDMREVLGAALLALGYSPNTQNFSEIEEAGILARKWKVQLANFISYPALHSLADAEYYVIQAYSSDIIKLQRDAPLVGYAIPKEGGAISCDHFAIPKGAPHKKLAHEFINFLLRPENAAINMAYTGFIIPIHGVEQYLDKEILENKAYFPTKEEMEKSVLLKDVGESLKFYQKEWEATKF